MPAKNTFHIVLVMEGHNIGLAPDSKAARTVTYDGHRLVVDLSRRA
jgi:hypothetical protein